MGNSVIYQPRGKAREYADWACNLYRGCTNGCVYCYAPSVLRMHKEAFHAVALPRDKILCRMKKDLKKLPPGLNVFLCFTCDPYPQAERGNELTRAAIKILHAAGHSVTVLTKNPTLACRDMDLYREADVFGTTLTFTLESAKKSLEYEPYAELPHQRYMGLEAFHKLGTETFVSLEPVIDATETLQIIRDTYRFVGLYKVGKLNYVKSDVDWHKFRAQVTALLDDLGARYMLKKSLRDL